MPPLPPLNALRAFEVAARTGSFVQAGAELGVTSAAISQQVRLLEDHLGKRLFARQGNRISLTDAGRAAYPRLEQALGDIAALTAQMREQSPKARLVVSCLPSIAELWLLPRLRGFDHAVSIVVADDLVNFARDGVDLRLTYGADLYPDHRVEVLFSDRVVALAAPGFMPDGGLATLPDAAFIHTDWGPTYATGPTWAAYMARARLDRLPDAGAGLRVGRTSLAVAAARAGLGVALGPARLAAAEVLAGRLEVVGDVALPMASDYVAVSPHALGRKRALRDLVGFLLR